MLIATWNVNSVRTRLDQVKEWLDKTQADLLCLQETKVEDDLFPKHELEKSGYSVYFHGQKAYNGVAMISREKLEDVKIGLIGELGTEKKAHELSQQARVISGLINGIRVINVYVPNGSSLKSEKYLYKIEWLNCLGRYLHEQQKRNEPICLLGDFNIALEARDIHSPERLYGGIMASKIEQDALKELLNGKLKDVFRVFEQETNHWSWWDYRSGAWQRDAGWRIDHIYLSEDLIQQAISCLIHKSVRGNDQPSDHVPVAVELCWPPEEEMDDFLD